MNGRGNSLPGVDYQRLQPARKLLPMGLIQTDPHRCRACHACVRHCPVKAIRVSADSAATDPARCIACGRCLQACSPQARTAGGALQRVRRLLDRREPTVAVLGPAFPAFYGDWQPGRLVAAIRQLGFQGVHEGAVGADLLARVVPGLLSAQGQPPCILSHCPAVVALVERHFPQLLRHLLPVVTPLVAAARLIRKPLDQTPRIVLISSCFATKGEMADDQIADSVDAALTFAELNLLLSDAGHTPQRLGEEDFTGPAGGPGRRFPLPAAALSVLGLGTASDPEVLSAEGADNVLEILRDLAAGRIHPRLVDLRWCRGGCLAGSDGGSRLSAFARAPLIRHYAATAKPAGEIGVDDVLPRSDLQRRFTHRHPARDLPDGEHIRRILQATDKYAIGDELNCGACGYPTCREHAAAVCRGLAREDMCRPWFIKRLSAQSRQMEQRYQLARLVLSGREQVGDLVARDAPTRKLLQIGRELAATESPLLLRGEPGTGKKTLARLIHDSSPRAALPMALVNCSGRTAEQLLRMLRGPDAPGIEGSEPPGGLLLMASGSTLVLEEIGDAPAEIQSFLAEVLNRSHFSLPGGKIEQPLNVRLIATSSRNLEAGLQEGWFNRDLYVHFSLCSLNLPPLRARGDSLPELVRTLLRRAAQRLHLQVSDMEPAVLKILQDHDWPGNLDELANVLERAALLADGAPIRAEHLPLLPTAGPAADSAERHRDFRASRDRQLQGIEHSLLERFLHENNGNVSAAARSANLPRRTFYRLLERHGLQRRESPRGAPRKGND